MHVLTLHHHCSGDHGKPVSSTGAKIARGSEATDVATGNGCRGGLQSVSRSYMQGRGELGGLASHGRGGRTMKCFGGLWATKSPQRLQP